MVIKRCWSDPPATKFIFYIIQMLSKRSKQLHLHIMIDSQQHAKLPSLVLKAPSWRGAATALFAKLIIMIRDLNEEAKPRSEDSQKRATQLHQIRLNIVTLLLANDSPLCGAKKKKPSQFIPRAVFLYPKAIICYHRPMVTTSCLTIGLHLSLPQHLDFNVIGRFFAVRKPGGAIQHNEDGAD